MCSKSASKQHHRAVVLGHGGGQQADHASCAVVPARGHPDLHLACPVRDDLADRQDDVELFAALGDRPHIAEVAARVARLAARSPAGPPMHNYLSMR
jgi:hypothetical protein